MSFDFFFIWPITVPQPLGRKCIRPAATARHDMTRERTGNAIELLSPLHAVDADAVSYVPSKLFVEWGEI